VSDLQIDPLDNDDLVIEQGDLVLIQDLPYAGQRMRIRLDFQQGEWFLNLDDGIPYRQDIFVRNPNLSIISAILRDRIISMPEINRLQTFELTFDNVTELLRLSFLAISIYGPVQAEAEAEDPASLLLLLTLQPYGRVMTS